MCCWPLPTNFDEKVYPNPFTDVLRITGIADIWRAVSLRVVNIAGVVVHTQTITRHDETIHLEHLPTGMYIIYLENGERAKTEKIIENDTKL